MTAPARWSSGGGRPRRRPSRSAWSSTAPGWSSVSTGLPFFDHMVAQLGKHAGFDLTLRAEGDLEVDAHHTVEDVGILLGECLRDALGDKAGVRRFASIDVPLDEALISVALDLSGRPFLVYQVDPGAGGEAYPIGSPPLRPAAGGGVLAGPGDLGRHHVALCAWSRGATPTTSSRPRSRGWPGPCATRSESKAAASRRPRASCEERGVIAVLDYGIGNLRSAEKALQHLGADAAPGVRPARPAGAAGVVLPGVGSFGRCMEALREAAWTGWPSTRSRRARPVPGDLRRDANAVRGVGGVARGAGPRGAARDGARVLPDGVKRPQMQWNRLLLGPSRRIRWCRDWARSPGSTSCTPTPRRPRRRTWWPPATTAGGGRRRGAGPGVGHPVPPREVGRRSAWPCWPTSWPPVAARRRRGAAGAETVDLYPGHRPARTGVACAWWRATSAGETVYGDDPVAVARSFQAAGARWIHVVDLDAARTGRARQPGRRGRDRGRRRRWRGRGSRRGRRSQCSTTPPSCCPAGWPGWS